MSSQSSRETRLYRDLEKIWRVLGDNGSVEIGYFSDPDSERTRKTIVPATLNQAKKFLDDNGFNIYEEGDFDREIWSETKNGSTAFDSQYVTSEDRIYIFGIYDSSSTGKSNSDVIKGP